MTVNISWWAPVLISGSALAITAFFAWRTDKDRKLATKLAREKDLHTWAREIGEVYVNLLSGPPDDRRKFLAKLSVLVDYGRLFFPNEKSERALGEYPVIGKRSSILDPLVETIRRGTDGSCDHGKCSMDWRRFTDELGKQTSAFAIDTSPEAQGLEKYRNS